MVFHKIVFEKNNGAVAFYFIAPNGSCMPFLGFENINYNKVNKDGKRTK